MMFSPIIPLLAQAGTQPNAQGEMIKMMGMMAIMVFAFYFALIRPQQKKAKEHESLIKTLKAGDRILTASGIIATVISVKDKSVSIRSADTKLEILKSAVTEVTERGDLKEA